MRISVVINTLNRANSLRRTLQSLRLQTFKDFEVIVVNGPSTDGTSTVLDEFRDVIRVRDCAEPRLAVSRNIGIDAAAGDVVAFIDDDGVATPDWLHDIAAAFADPSVGAAGGVVIDHTGVSLQYRYAACHRNGEPVFDVAPPLDRFTSPGADPVAYLQGTNMAFRRRVLEEIGAFDENIYHFFDDVDICLRIVDHGFTVRQLAGAAVHHKFLESHIRDHRRITLDPFNQLSDRIYFGLKHGRSQYGLSGLLRTLSAETEGLRHYAHNMLADETMTREQHEYFLGRLDEALVDGIARGHTVTADPRPLAAPAADSFRPFEVASPTTERLRLCFISSEYPPGDFGGPGRYTHELATGFAAAGHEVHVITASSDIRRVDLEEGVWVHRQPDPQRLVPELTGFGAAPYLARCVDAYREVRALAQDRHLDVVMSPVWLFEGLVAALDPDLEVVVTVITAMKAVGTLAAWARTPEAEQMVRLEEEYLAHAEHLHVISEAIRDRAVADYGISADKAFLVPLGIHDRRDSYPRSRKDDGRLRVLYVGRLEARKGADVILDVASDLLDEFPHLEFVLVGREIPIDGGQTHRERFSERHRSRPDIVARVTFSGLVSDDELFQHYADCDIFCLPTHYESFGLVFVEAMMFGKPVVGSRVGGVPEVVVDGEQGVLCPVDDVTAVRDALRTLITDDALRERYGQRSRSLYETQWQASVAVRRMTDALLPIALAGRTRPATPARDDVVAAELAAVLGRVGDLPADVARSAADRLLDPLHHPVDRTARLAASMATDDAATFVSETYQLLLDRHPLPDESLHWVTALHAEPDRAKFVAGVLASPEFTQRGIPHRRFVTPELHTTTPPAVAPPEGPSRRLADVPVLGKALRYLKSVVYLPWNFHRFFTFLYPEHQRQMHAIMATNDDVAERVERLEVVIGELLAVQFETNVLTRSHIARIVGALESIGDVMAEPGEPTSS